MTDKMKGLRYEQTVDIRITRHKNIGVRAISQVPVRSLKT